MSSESLLIQRMRRAVRQGLRESRETQERLALLNRPWEERFLHWAYDGDTWVMHGELVPPRGGLSITPLGWCPGLRDHAADPTR